MKNLWFQFPEEGSGVMELLQMLPRLVVMSGADIENSPPPFWLGFLRGAAIMAQLLRDERQREAIPKHAKSAASPGAACEALHHILKEIKNANDVKRVVDELAYGRLSARITARTFGTEHLATVMKQLSDEEREKLIKNLRTRGAPRRS